MEDDGKEKGALQEAIDRGQFNDDKKEKDEIKEQEDIDNQYDFCPLCGVHWDSHSDEECKELQLMKDKPTFDIYNLDNYKESYLKEIIIWQDKRIEYLEKRGE